MTEEVAKRLEALNKKLQNFLDNPWIMRTKPFHVVGDVYFVGNNYVSSFLIASEEGLILIDTAFAESAYLLFDGIRALGFNPADIRCLFLSHGHFDHCGAARLIHEYSGCEIFLGKEDHMFFTERPDLILFENHVPRFTIHRAYDYDKPMDFGNVVITPVHTPGHTPGTTSFFIETRHGGKIVICAMHGGLGLNGLSKDELRDNRLPESLQQEYLDSLLALQKKKVDVVLASHAHQYNMLERAALDDGSGEVFLDKENGWYKMLDKNIESIREMM
ncbi:MAG: MBL fold metallo-hydrolase [Synergistaceae bacterium]|jgi:metallo-beta-lactamase class B|nr:MBL fold metallo-hydrolase [Synergistaceae bacterium]